MVNKIYYFYIEIKSIEINSFLQFLHRISEVYVYSLLEDYVCFRVEKRTEDFKQLVKEADIIGLKLYKDRDKKYGTHNEDY